jgi:hypothetical protein
VKPVSLAVLAAVLVCSACSGESDRPAGSGPAVQPPTSIPDDAGSSADAAADSSTPESSGSTPGGSVTAAATTPARQLEVPATGIPGLDSDDRFCAAWSRFGGSWQVLSVGSAFLGDPDRVARWEVASSSVVAEAYAELMENFPEQLAAEAEIVGEGYFGVLLRRSSDAGSALLAAGADSAALGLLSEAWLAALAVRDPADPDLTFVVPTGLDAMVAEAAAALMAQRVEFHLDPTMVVSVETPLTDAFLERACPDQGTLTGQEVGGT